jgi:hypothetical protein
MHGAGPVFTNVARSQRPRATSVFRETKTTASFQGAADSDDVLATNHPEARNVASILIGTVILPAASGRSVPSPGIWIVFGIVAAVPPQNHHDRLHCHCRNSFSVERLLAAWRPLRCGQGRRIWTRCQRLTATAHRNRYRSTLNALDRVAVAVDGQIGAA